MTDGSARQSISLDGSWRFVRDPRQRFRAAELPEGEPIRVPGCWEAQVDAPFGIVHAWYHRFLSLPPSWAGHGDPVLRCSAVMYRCEVWLNGRHLGSHEGGYLPFEVTLAGARWGSPNHLALLVTNPLNVLHAYPQTSIAGLKRAQRSAPQPPISEIPHGKQTWYGSQSGPWRSVSVEMRPAVHVRHLRVRADWRTGVVRLTGTCSPAPSAARVAVRVLDPDGRLAVAQSVGLDVDGSFSADLAVADPQAWDIGQPNLYRLEAQLLVSDHPVDALTARFGFREVRTEKGRVMLNGRPILLRGALDQDLYHETISTPPSRELLDRQLALARDMGLNLLRLHIKSPDPAYLDAADEAGMLLWCELPSWLVLTPDAARRAERMLDGLVDLVGSHPSVIIWTIINEDWGTDLRHSSTDRRWLSRMTTRLRDLDPTRLVVDNSPCPTAGSPNFHLDTDIADFHLYAAMPDAAPRWSTQMAGLAERPAWLWSPHGDAVRRGDEPVVVSEFGNWALPDLQRYGTPRWAMSGDGPTRPAEVEQRFAEQRLDRIWTDVGALAVATQRHQVDALQFETGEIRRHAGLAGMVVTELTDAHWEANGLLELDRRPKAAHGRLIEVLGPTTLIPELPRRDLWAGDTIDVPITLSSDSAAGGGALRWSMGSSSGTVAVGGWAAATATALTTLQIPIPDVRVTTDEELRIELTDAGHRMIAHTTVACALVPGRLRKNTAPRALRFDDPMDLWELGPTIAAAGHVDESVAPEPDDLVVTSRLDRRLLRHANAGGRILLLARSEDAVAKGMKLERPIRIRARWPSHEQPGRQFTWTGDWVSAYSWILPDLSPDLPMRAPLDFAYLEVLPDHILDGYDPLLHAAEAPAGMFVGWIHAPVALIWSFRQGQGRITVTTFHVAPECGPVATVLLATLLRIAADR